MQTDFDALIVGAGPAGSATAILLASAGWSVALIEKQRFPRRKVCGECIAASNLPLLTALGVAPAFQRAAGPALREVSLLSGRRTVTASLPPAAHAAERWGHALGRETLDTLLRDQALVAGAHVLQPARVENIDGVSGAWRVDVRHQDSSEQHTLLAPVLILAHGSWEALPSRPAAQRTPRRAADLLAFKANFRGTTLREGALPVLALDGGYGGMVVADGGLTTIACCIRRDRLRVLRRAMTGSPAGEVVEAWLRRECDGVRLALHGASRDGSWLAAGPLNPGIRLRAGEGLFRVGNAAGEAHPIIGEGISMALQSAWLLCRLLTAEQRRQDAPGAGWQHRIARRYGSQWRRRFAPRLRLAAALAQVAMRPTATATLIAIVSRWPNLLTLAAKLGGKIRGVEDTEDRAYPLSQRQRTAQSTDNLYFISRHP